MKYYYILIALLLCVCCKKEQHNTDNDYFAFGKAYGECGGNCATFYKIEAGKLYADDMEYYMGNFTFNTIVLVNSDYLQAKILEDNFPVYLTNHPNQTFGCPDCHDQGGLHIQRRINGDVKEWHIDTDTAEQPVEIRPYVQQVFNTIDSLQ